MRRLKEAVVSEKYSDSSENYRPAFLENVAKKRGFYVSVCMCSSYQDVLVGFFVDQVNRCV